EAGPQGRALPQAPPVTDHAGRPGCGRPIAAPVGGGVVHDDDRAEVAELLDDASDGGRLVEDRHDGADTRGGHWRQCPRTSAACPPPRASPWTSTASTSGGAVGDRPANSRSPRIGVARSGSPGRRSPARVAAALAT